MLVRILNLVLRGVYEVRDEVQVGKLPLKLDVLLIRRRKGRLRAAAARDLAALAARLNRFTLLEFKGPTDALERGDLDTLVGCAFQFRAQQRRRISHKHMSLMILAPRVTRAFREDVRSAGLQLHFEENGVFRIDRLPFATWMIETDRLAGVGEPYLSFFSRVFLRRGRDIMEQLRDHGYGRVLDYVIQQIEQFNALGEEFTMQHLNFEYMDQTLEELRDAVLKGIPIQKRLEGLSPVDRLEGLSPEDRLEGLSPEELDRLRNLLKQKKQSSRSGKTKNDR